MARIRRYLAICLALALGLMLGTPSVGLAEGPGNWNANSGPTDGGDGHPWDDGTTEESLPDDDETDPETIQSEYPGTEPVLTIERGFLSWTQNTLISLWFKVRNVTLSQTTALKAKAESKSKKSRRVR